MPEVPIFPHPLEAKAMEALNTLLLIRHSDPRPIEMQELQPLTVRLTSVVDCVFPMVGSQSEFSGPDSAQGSDYVHPIKVAELAIVIGREMGMPRSQLIALATASALMNSGYLMLKRSVLDEPTVLAEGVWEQHVHEHPDESVALVARAGLSDDVLAAMREHHERWDGSGFPRGLKQDEISPMARIIGVADAYITLRSTRTGHVVLSAPDALETIKASRGVMLDPHVVDVFEAVVSKYPEVPHPTSRMGERLAAMGFDSDAPPLRPKREAPRAEDFTPPLRAREEDAEYEAARRERTSGKRIVSPSRPAPGLAPPRPVTVARSPARATSSSRRAKPIAALRDAEPIGVPQRQRRRRSLFSTSLYLDAASHGDWHPRGL